MKTDEYARIHRHELSHFWYRGVHALFQRALVTSTPTQRPRVLDAGCGTGGLITSLSTALPQASFTGVDLSPLALTLARGRDHARLVQATIESLPFAASSFDVVVSADAIYHAWVHDDGAALRELTRVVRPGGAVLLNVPAHSWLRRPHDAVVQTARRYSRSDLRRIAASAGLVVERLAWFNCLLFPVALAIATASRWMSPRSDLKQPCAPVNAALAAWMRLEAWLTLRVPLPLGLSLFAVLRRPAA